jgi:hypothetical protein
MDSTTLVSVTPHLVVEFHKLTNKDIVHLERFGDFSPCV